MNDAIPRHYFGFVGNVFPISFVKVNFGLTYSRQQRFGRVTFDKSEWGHALRSNFGFKFRLTIGKNKIKYRFYPESIINNETPRDQMSQAAS